LKNQSFERILTFTSQKNCKVSFLIEESSFEILFNEYSICDETLPNFIKSKHPRTIENKKQRARTKVQAGKRAPKEVSHAENDHEYPI
jgi:hypothetical protein